ncbi:ParA family protein [Streptomyces sp. NBC_01474]|uniref:KGGVGR-motif variant AAA ATPase n=1 Tax=Streptomyces sp. NBC_01474 TaxID=2903880 RepID=UPI002DDB2F23|nr:AAA family ATPase [Streptomyces sp. NBC_01474]WSD97743.1 ParA family protein [Streptomyces sp. NBC_01474]
MSPRTTPVRFDEAGPLALSLARSVADEEFMVLLVRDVRGRFTLIVDDREQSVDENRRERWHAALVEQLTPYVTGRPLTLASQMITADALLNSKRAAPDTLRPSGGAGSVRLLDNTVVGEDWANVSTPGPEVDGTRTHRTALYGFKGGVGRTTATAMLARRLADDGNIVLVVDLDLESPGAGPLLAGPNGLPRNGIVDHLVEAAVGSADGLELVTRTGYAPRSRSGELWVAPARGQGTDGVPYAYVDKLNRVYADLPGSSFADRLADAVEACERAVTLGDSGRRPDVVLLDSRAGIHDVAAVTISRLCDLALLFGADSAQTWAGYGDLFAAWQSSGRAPDIREKLRMVASMVPDTVHHSMDDYLDAFTARSYECFTALYDELAPGEPPSAADEGARYAFAPSEKDDSAPHHPIPVLFEPGLVGLGAGDSRNWQDRAFVKAAYGEFLDTAVRLITAGPGDEEGTR